jgi:hypothetical protein
VSFTMNGGFATLHMNGLRWFIGSVWCHQFYQLRDRFFYGWKPFPCICYCVFWTSRLVRSSCRVAAYTRAYQ